MKTIITIITIVFITIPLNAQFTKNNAIYLSGNFSAGNYSGIATSLNYVYKESYSFQFGYSGFSRKSANKPDDHEVSGILGLLNFGGVLGWDHMENYHLMAGKIFLLCNNNQIRCNASAGLAYTDLVLLENWKKIDADWLGSYYSYDRNQYSTYSIIINPKIEYPFTKYLGITVSPTLIINKHSTYAGVGIGLMLGILRN